MKYIDPESEFEADKFSESVTQDTETGFAYTQPGYARSHLFSGSAK